MNLIAMAVEDIYSTEAHIRASNLVKIANSIAETGVVQNDSDRDVLHGCVLREYVRRPYLFLQPDFNRDANVFAMEGLEFEPDGQFIKLCPQIRHRSGAR